MTALRKQFCDDMSKFVGQADKFTKNLLENGTQVLVLLHTINAQTT